MQKNDPCALLRSTSIRRTIAICFCLFGLLLLLGSSLIGLFALFTHSTTYNTPLLISGFTGMWLIWIGLTLFEHFSPIVIAVRCINIIGLPFLVYLYLTTSDARYFYAGMSLFWCVLLVEQAMAIHREFDTYYSGLRLLTLLGSWAMSVVALALTIAYMIPLSDALSFLSQLGVQAPTVILFAGYGFLSMLKKGITPHTKHSA